MNIKIIIIVAISRLHSTDSIGRGGLEFVQQKFHSIIGLSLDRYVNCTFQFIILKAEHIIKWLIQPENKTSKSVENEKDNRRHRKL